MNRFGPSAARGLIVAAKLERSWKAAQLFPRKVCSCRGAYRNDGGVVPSPVHGAAGAVGLIHL